MKNIIIVLLLVIYLSVGFCITVHFITHIKDNDVTVGDIPVLIVGSCISPLLATTDYIYDKYGSYVLIKKKGNIDDKNLHRYR